MRRRRRMCVIFGFNFFVKWHTCAVYRRMCVILEKTLNPKMTHMRWWIIFFNMTHMRCHTKADQARSSSGQSLTIAHRSDKTCSWNKRFHSGRIIYGSGSCGNAVPLQNKLCGEINNFRRSKSQLKGYKLDFFSLIGRELGSCSLIGGELVWFLLSVLWLVKSRIPVLWLVESVVPGSCSLIGGEQAQGSCSLIGGECAVWFLLSDWWKEWILFSV